jgi:hypothetical protein
LATNPFQATHSPRQCKQGAKDSPKPIEMLGFFNRGNSVPRCR